MWGLAHGKRGLPPRQKRAGVPGGCAVMNVSPVGLSKKENGDFLH